MKSSIKFSVTFYMALFIVLIIVYWPVLSSDVVLGYDDSMLLKAVSTISSLSDYVAKIMSGLIFDIQPVRDLSYAIDLYLKDNFNYSFHLTNVLVWFGCCVLISKIISKFTDNKFLIVSATFFVALNPLAASSVAWIAARKHIFSLFFILLATHESLSEDFSNNKVKSKLLIIIYFLLSVFSHPINSLWPIWLVCFLYVKNLLSKNRAFVSTLWTLMAFVLALNLYYYSAIYSDASSLSKFNGPGFDLLFSLKSFGRYFFLTVFPFDNLPISHSIYSVKNYFGIFLVTIFIAWLGFRKDKKLYLGFLFFILPLLIVCLKPTNIFCSDTYLLTSSLGIYFCLFYRLYRLNKKVILMSFSLINIIFLVYTNKYSEIYNDELGLWSYSYEKEPNSQSAIILAYESLKKGNYDQNQKLVSEIKANWPNQPFLPELVADSIFFNRNLDNEHKFDLLNNEKTKSASAYLYLSIVATKIKRPAMVEKSLNGLLSDGVKLKKEFKGKEERVTAIVYYTCTYNKVNECLNMKDKLINLVAKKNFDDKFLSEFLLYLNRDKNYNVELGL